MKLRSASDSVLGLGGIGRGLVRSGRFRGPGRAGGVAIGGAAVDGCACSGLWPWGVLDASALGADEERGGAL